MLDTRSVLYSSVCCSRPKLYISLQFGQPYIFFRTFQKTNKKIKHSCCVKIRTLAASVLHAYIHLWQPQQVNYSPYQNNGAQLDVSGTWSALSGAAGFLETCHFLFTCQWCCTILATPSYVLSRCYFTCLKLIHFPKPPPSRRHTKQSWIL